MRLGPVWIADDLPEVRAVRAGGSVLTVPVTGWQPGADCHMLQRCTCLTFGALPVWQVYAEKYRDAVCE